MPVQRQKPPTERQKRLAREKQQRQKVRADRERRNARCMAMVNSIPMQPPADELPEAQRRRRLHALPNDELMSLVLHCDRLPEREDWCRILAERLGLPSLANFNSKGEILTMHTVWTSKGDIVQRAKLPLNVFHKLLAFLENSYGLRDDDNVSTAQKLLIFLSICGGGHSLLQVEGDFGHPNDVVLSAFNDVLKSLLGLRRELVQPPMDCFCNNGFFARNPKYKQFQDALGVLGRSYIPIRLGPEESRRAGTWMKNGQTCQYVLAICNFDMKFKFVLPGWEGNAKDDQVLRSAYECDDKEFWVPMEDYYYLADKTFASSDRKGALMTQYPGVKVSDRNQTRLAEPARSKLHEKCWFNETHAELRYVVDQTFQVLMKRFPILASPLPDFSVRTQIDLVFALTGIHNYMNDCGEDPRKKASSFNRFDMIRRENEEGPDRRTTCNASEPSEDPEERKEREKTCKQRRDKVAKALYSQYLHEAFSDLA